MPQESVSASQSSGISNSTSRESSGSFAGPHVLYYASGGVDSAGQYQAPGLWNQAYTTALALNNASYADIQRGYTDVLNRTAAGTDRVAQGYESLGRDVQARLAGAEGSERLRIADDAQRATANARQGLISAGLGNTTITGGVQRGIDADKARADLALTNQMANLRANYQSQIGQAGFGAQMQGLGQIGSLANNYMGTVGAYRMPIPDWAPNYTRSQSDAESTSSQVNTSVQNSNSSSGGGGTGGGGVALPGFGGGGGVALSNGFAAASQSYEQAINNALSTQAQAALRSGYNQYLTNPISGVRMINGWQFG